MIHWRSYRSNLLRFNTKGPRAQRAKEMPSTSWKLPFGLIGNVFDSSPVPATSKCEQLDTLTECRAENESSLKSDKATSLEIPSTLFELVST